MLVSKDYFCQNPVMGTILVKKSNRKAMKNLQNPKIWTQFSKKNIYPDYNKHLICMMLQKRKAKDLFNFTEKVLLSSFIKVKIPQISTNTLKLTEDDVIRVL